MKSVRVIEASLPDKVKGVCVEDGKGYIVLVNDKLPDLKKSETVLHEYKHLIMRHQYRDISVDEAEKEITQGLKYSVELRG